MRQAYSIDESKRARRFLIVSRAGDDVRIGAYQIGRRGIRWPHFTDAQASTITAIIAFGVLMLVMGVVLGLCFVSKYPLAVTPAPVTPVTTMLPLQVTR